MNRAALIRQRLEEVRAQTLQLCARVSDADLRRQVHKEFSPLGWHLGHVGVTEAFWILQCCKGGPPLSAAYNRFFTPTETPKPERVHLPTREEILAYLHTVREHVLNFLTGADLDSDHPLVRDGRIFNMLLQHEEQHQETMLIILRLFAAERYDKERDHQHPGEGERDSSACGLRMTDHQDHMVLVSAGSFVMGSDDVACTLDNERPQHEVFVPAFLIDRYPVTNAEFLQFVAGGGYYEQSCWTPEGWQWREQNRVEHPLYWRKQRAGGWVEIGLKGVYALAPRNPVQCVSWYEADAYARWSGKRLPTEEEWEKAASWSAERSEKLFYPWGKHEPDTSRCNFNAHAEDTTPVDQYPTEHGPYGCADMLGNVWEWTATWFQPYPGFIAFPYEGYSVPYFDQQHRVLRGGSWATRRQVIRATFRNWYQPGVREIFAGFRCAKNL
jgi:ergothioneine biosynthesis protein EgtB